MNSLGAIPSRFAASRTWRHSGPVHRCEWVNPLERLDPRITLPTGRPRLDAMSCSLRTGMRRVSNKRCYRLFGAGFSRLVDLLVCGHRELAFAPPRAVGLSSSGVDLRVMT